MAHPRHIKTRSGIMVSVALAFLLLSITLPAAPASVAKTARAEVENPPPIVSIPPGQAYRQTNLVSDIPGLALVQDPLLVNPRGLARGTSGAFWTANNRTSTAVIYAGDVAGSPLVRLAGTPPITIPGGPPTGAVETATSFAPRWSRLSSTPTSTVTASGRDQRSNATRWCDEFDLDEGERLRLAFPHPPYQLSTGEVKDA
jgi:hypothetical protein